MCGKNVSLLEEVRGLGGDFAGNGSVLLPLGFTDKMPDYMTCPT